MQPRSVPRTAAPARVLRHVAAADAEADGAAGTSALGWFMHGRGASGARGGGAGEVNRTLASTTIVAGCEEKVSTVASDTDRAQ